MNDSFIKSNRKLLFSDKLDFFKRAVDSEFYPKFENYLMDFLVKGRGGALLATKVQRGIAYSASMRNNVEQRVSALDSEKNNVIDTLNSAKKDLKEIKTNKATQSKAISKEQANVKLILKKVLDTRRQNFNSTLRPQLISEPDINILR